jgi:hypothetical protein
MLAAAVVLLATGRASAIIEAMYPLSRVLDESTNILVGRIEKVDNKALTIVMRVDAAIKGKAEYEVVNINVGLGPQPQQRWLMDVQEPKGPALLFYKREGAGIAALVHHNGYWWQLFATDEPNNRDKVWWRFSHVETRMNRTWNGPTAELVKTVEAVLAKKIKAPAPNPNVPQLKVEGRGPRKARPVDPALKDGFAQQSSYPASSGGETRGVSLVDVDGDGRLDIYACRTNGDLLLLNIGDGKFRDVTKQWGIAGGSRSATWADYNGDGRPDLVTCNFQLFTNLGDKLRDDTALLPQPSAKAPEGAGWIDYDGDGRPDILITNGGEGIVLYRNTGEADKPFVDVSQEAGLGKGGFGHDNGDFISLFDFDGDGRQDLYYNLGEGALARCGRDGKFARRDKSALALVGGSGYKRGLACGDYDNDGTMDIFMPAGSKGCLYHNCGDGTFKDVYGDGDDLAMTDEASFAAAFGDVNGDGLLDLAVCHAGGPTRLYLGNGRGQFQNVSLQVGVEKIVGAKSVAIGDLDGDGAPDLVLSLDDKVIVCHNSIALPQGRRWATVVPAAGPGSLGTTVRFFGDDGKLLAMRDVGLPTGCGGQQPPWAFASLPAGECGVSVVFGDGRFARATIAAGSSPVVLTVDQVDIAATAAPKGPALAARLGAELSRVAPPSTRPATQPASRPR